MIKEGVKQVKDYINGVTSAHSALLTPLVTTAMLKEKITMRREVICTEEAEIGS